MPLPASVYHMAGDPFTIDPNTGSIFFGQGDSIGTSVDSIFLNGSSYTLQGSTLVPDIDGFPNIALPSDRQSVVWADPSANTQVSYVVDRRQINSTAVSSRMYGVGGTVQVSLADGTVMNVELANTTLTKAGTRLFQTMDANGQIIVSETGYNFGTNDALRAALGDAEARYLSPLEATRELLYRNIGSIARDEVAKYLQEHKDILRAYANPFYSAISMMISKASLAELDVYSNYWV